MHSRKRSTTITFNCRLQCGIRNILTSNHSNVMQLWRHQIWAKSTLDRPIAKIRQNFALSDLDVKTTGEGRGEVEDITKISHRCSTAPRQTTTRQRRRASKSRPTFYILPTVKIIGGWANVWRTVLRSAEDTTSDMLLIRSRCAWWEIKHNFPASFSWTHRSQCFILRFGGTTWIKFGVELGLSNANFKFSMCGFISNLVCLKDQT